MFRTIISRLIAGPIAALVTWLVGLGLDLDPAFADHLTEATTILLMAVALTVYGLVHKLVDRKANPDDVAKERV
jgi:hypothetical protein